MLRVFGTGTTVDRGSWGALNGREAGRFWLKTPKTVRHRAAHAPLVHTVLKR
jgi:hypothetical protein